MRAPADSLSELADRLVETGMPWKTPGADVRHPLRDRLLVDVDAVAVARRERARVAGRLREADQQQGDRRDERSSSSVAGTMSRAGQRRAPAGRAARARRAPRRARRGRTAADAIEPADDEHERSRNRGREEAQREDQRQRDEPRRASVVQWMSPSARSHDPSSRQALSPLDDVPVSFGSSPIDDVDRGAGQESGDDRLREEPGDPAEPEQRRAARNRHPGHERDRRDELGGLRASDARSRAPHRRRPRRATSSARSRSAARCRRARR